MLMMSQECPRRISRPERIEWGPCLIARKDHPGLAADEPELDPGRRRMLPTDQGVAGAKQMNDEEPSGNRPQDPPDRDPGDRRRGGSGRRRPVTSQVHERHFRRGPAASTPPRT